MIYSPTVVEHALRTMPNSPFGEDGDLEVTEQDARIVSNRVITAMQSGVSGAVQAAQDIALADLAQAKMYPHQSLGGVAE